MLKYESPKTMFWKLLSHLWFRVGNNKFCENSGYIQTIYKMLHSYTAEYFCKVNGADQEEVFQAFKSCSTICQEDHMFHEKKIKNTPLLHSY